MTGLARFALRRTRRGDDLARAVVDHHNVANGERITRTRDVRDEHVQLFARQRVDLDQGFGPRRGRTDRGCLHDRVGQEAVGELPDLPAGVFRIALDRGLSRIHYGRTAEEIKSTLGV